MDSIHPKDLTPHPRLKQMPQWDESDPRFLSLVEDIRERGIQDPIKVDSQNQIIDGRHRWRAAKRLQLQTVPVMVVANDQIASVIVGSLIQRRHFTKGQRAYLVAPYLDSLFEESKNRRLHNLKHVGKSTLPPLGESPDDLAEQLGFSLPLLKQARQLHKLFTETPKLRAEFEPRILDEEDPIGLGAAIAGIAGQQHTKGKSKHTRAEEQLTLFNESLTTLGHRFKYWNKLKDEDRDTAVTRIRETVAAMPPELRAEWKKAISAADKAEKPNQ